MVAITGLGTAAAAAPPVVKWRHLSSRTGDLPEPNGGVEQTACVVADFNGDGAADIVIAERSRAPAVIGLRHVRGVWQRFVIDDHAWPVEAGGAAADLDRDGDLDLVLGGDYRSDVLVWYENLGLDANAAKPWPRRFIKRSGAKGHHDQVAADLLGLGRPQVVFWNQGARRLFLALSPEDPRGADSWPLREPFDASAAGLANKPEGIFVFDVDGDGRRDLLGDAWWFRNNGDGTVRAVRVGEQPGRILAGRFRGGRVPQIVLAPGDADGPLLFSNATMIPSSPQTGAAVPCSMAAAWSTATPSRPQTLTATDISTSSVPKWRNGACAEPSRTTRRRPPGCSTAMAAAGSQPSCSRTASDSTRLASPT